MKPWLGHLGGRGWKLALRLVGFAVAMGLLAWCLSEAFKPSNREQLQRLADAPLWAVAALMGLHAGSIVLNGLVLWAQMRPVRRLRALDVCAVQSVCVVLGYLPFKIATVFRVLAHRARDGLPVLTIGAWLAASAVVLLGVIGSLTAASMARGGVDSGWFAIAGVLVALGTATLVSVSRALRGEPGVERAAALARALGVGVAARAVRSRRFAQLHEGVAMLASWRWVSLCVVIRLVDVGVQSARFWLVGYVLGVGISPEQAVLIGSAYFLLGVLSPAGALGAREAGSTGLAAALGITALTAGEGGASFAVVALTVSASEAVVAIAMAGGGLAWLGKDWRRGRRGANPGYAETPSSGT